MSLRIIMGNMFSGKTTEMIRRLKRYKVIGKQVVVINSQKDIPLHRCGQQKTSLSTIYDRVLQACRRYFERIRDI